MLIPFLLDLLFYPKSAAAFCSFSHAKVALVLRRFRLLSVSELRAQPQLFRHLPAIQLLHLLELALVELFRELFNGLAIRLLLSHEHQPLHLAAQLTQVALTDLRLLFKAFKLPLVRS